MVFLEFFRQVARVVLGRRGEVVRPQQQPPAEHPPAGEEADEDGNEPQDMPEGNPLEPAAEESHSDESSTEDEAGDDDEDSSSSEEDDEKIDYDQEATKSMCEELAAGNLSRVYYWLENGANPNAPFGNRASGTFTRPLIFACRSGYLELVRFLLDLNDDRSYLVDANAQDNFGNPALLVASAEGRVDIVKLLLENVNHVLDVTVSTKNEGTGALHIAACKGYLPVVRTLIETGQFPVDVKSTKAGMTPLGCAALWGRYYVVRYLVCQANADTSIECEYYKEDPIFLAIRGGHTEIVRYFVEHMGFEKAILRRRSFDGALPFFAACQSSKSLGVAKWMVKSLRFDPNTVCKNGNALHFAVIGRTLEAIKWLVEDQKCHIDYTDANGIGPLHTALFQSASQEQTEAIISYLLSQGACIDLSDHSGQTPLMSACILNHRPAVLFLLQKGASVFYKRRTSDGKTARAIAQRQGGQIRDAFQQRQAFVQRCWSLTSFLTSREWFARRSGGSVKKRPPARNAAGVGIGDLFSAPETTTAEAPRHKKTRTM